MNDRRVQNRVLMIAYHFPPFKGSSGVERTLGFCRHLGAYGWSPVVLSASEMAYEAVGDDRLGNVPESVVVARALALDTKRHLSLLGRYPRFLALPDRWVSWLMAGVVRGLMLVRRHRPRVIWSTYPIATAHLIGCALHVLTGVPWVADFRDPMVEYNARKGTFSPPDSALRRSRLWVEGLCARYAARTVFCTETAARIFRERYPKFPGAHALVIPNGFDESVFRSAAGLRKPDESNVAPAERNDRPVVLLHSGVLYPGPDRDPTAFLTALARVLDSHPEWRGRVRVILRATGFDEIYGPLVERLGLQGTAQLCPMISYQQAIVEMCDVDALIVVQGYTSNPAVPAKLYEYIRARKPILGLVDAGGETARLLRERGVGVAVPPDDDVAIEDVLPRFFSAVVEDAVPVLAPEQADQFERRHRAHELAECFRDVQGVSA